MSSSPSTTRSVIPTFALTIEHLSDDDDEEVCLEEEEVDLRSDGDDDDQELLDRLSRSSSLNAPRRLQAMSSEQSVLAMRNPSGSSRGCPVLPSTDAPLMEDRRKFSTSSDLAPSLTSSPFPSLTDLTVLTAQLSENAVRPTDLKSALLYSLAEEHERSDDDSDDSLDQKPNVEFDSIDHQTHLILNQHQHQHHHHHQNHDHDSDHDANLHHEFIDGQQISSSSSSSSYTSTRAANTLENTPFIGRDTSNSSSISCASSSRRYSDLDNNDRMEGALISLASSEAKRNSINKRPEPPRPSKRTSISEIQRRGMSTKVDAGALLNAIGAQFHVDSSTTTLSDSDSDSSATTTSSSTSTTSTTTTSSSSSDTPSDTPSSSDSSSASTTTSDSSSASS